MSKYRVIEITDPMDPMIDELHEFCARIDEPDTRCAPGAEIPALYMLRHAARSGDGLRLWAILDVAFDDEPVGLVVTGPDGQFQWLKAKLDVIGEVTYLAGKHISKALGVRAWGIMQNDEIRNAIAKAGPKAGVDHKEKRVWWDG